MRLGGKEERKKEDAVDVGVNTGGDTSGHEVSLVTTRTANVGLYMVLACIFFSQIILSAFHIFVFKVVC